MYVNTVSDLMRSAAMALSSRDANALEELLRISEDWLQDRSDAEAQKSMLYAMLDAVEDLTAYEDYEED